MIGKRGYGYTEDGWLRDQYWCEDNVRAEARAEADARYLREAHLMAAQLAINPPIVIANRDDVPKWLEPQLRDKRLLLCPM